MSPDAPEVADEGRLSHLLWDVSARALSHAEAALADSALSTASSGVLDQVAARPGTSIAEMARWLPTSAQAISQIVARLERLGYLERRLGARGHGTALFVTAAGARAHDEADQRIGVANQELAETLGQDEHDRLVELLQHARAALRAVEAATAGGASHRLPDP